MVKKLFALLGCYTARLYEILLIVSIWIRAVHDVPGTGRGLASKYCILLKTAPWKTLYLNASVKIYGTIVLFMNNGFIAVLWGE